MTENPQSTPQINIPRPDGNNLVITNLLQARKYAEEIDQQIADIVAGTDLSYAPAIELIDALAGPRGTSMLNSIVPPWKNDSASFNESYLKVATLFEKLDPIHPDNLKLPRSDDKTPKDTYTAALSARSIFFTGAELDRLLHRMHNPTIANQHISNHVTETAKLDRRFKKLEGKLSSLTQSEKLLEDFDRTKFTWRERAKRYQRLMFGSYTVAGISAVAVAYFSEVLLLTQTTVGEDAGFLAQYFAHQPGLLRVVLLLTFIGVAIRFGGKMRHAMLDAEMRSTMFDTIVSLGLHGRLAEGDWRYVLHAMFRRPTSEGRDKENGLSLEDISTMVAQKSGIAQK